MTTEEILEAAGEARPDLMDKVAKAVVVLEAWDPEMANELVGDIEKVASYAAGQMEKTAAALPAGAAKAAAGGFTHGAKMMGGMLLAGLGAAVASDLYDVAKRGITRGGNLKRIMEANPELKQIDKSRLRASFDAVHRYAPEMTADPLVGGAVVKSVAELPGNEFQSIKAIIDARKGLVESKTKSFMPVKTAK